MKKRHPHRPLRRAGGRVTVVQIDEDNEDGTAVAHPVSWKGTPPQILVLSDKVAPGEKALVRLVRTDSPEAYEAYVLKRLRPNLPRLVIGFVQKTPAGLSLVSLERNHRRPMPLAMDKKVQDGDLVCARTGRPRGQILEILAKNSECTASIVACHKHNLPLSFPPTVQEECAKIDPQAWRKHAREDLSKTPFVTIDPEGARDHDDAVWAERDTNPQNKDGFLVIVAIADVAHYVRPHTVLDEEARRRGNSVYFPDKVIPMLPKRLSNDLCSLNPGEERPCVAVRMVFCKNGHRQTHSIVRAHMRSTAALTYPQAQTQAPHSLWEAYTILKKQRQERDPLDLHIPERRFYCHKDGTLKSVEEEEHLESHRLIEEFMIAANVAVAHTLEEKQKTFLRRIHDPPSTDGLRDAIKTLSHLNLKMPTTKTIKTSHLNQILKSAKKTPAEFLVSETILRAQSQALYGPRRGGHFGLNLAKYTHFTSPIRRYADLCVHRAILEDHSEQLSELETLGEHLSACERTAMFAERDAQNYLLADWLAPKIGSVFGGRISGIIRQGFFVRLKTGGAEGFIPMRILGRTARFDAKKLLLHWRGKQLRLGDTVQVKLQESNPATGSLLFSLDAASPTP